MEQLPVEGKSPPVKERVVGRGLRRAVGELITCPYCVGTWIAAGFTYALLAWPRETRLYASIFAVEGVSRLVHKGARSLQEAS